MKTRPLIAALALTFVSTAAFAAPPAPSHPALGPCAALGKRFDAYLAPHGADRQGRVTEAVALRSEGASLCRLGMVKPGAVYLRSAIATLIGKPAA